MDDVKICVWGDKEAKLEQDKRCSRRISHTLRRVGNFPCRTLFAEVSQSFPGQRYAKGDMQSFEMFQEDLPSTKMNLPGDAKYLRD